MHGLWGYEHITETPERLQFQMISFTLDPQWCGLLFSIYCKHEKVSVVGPDPFSTCSLAGPPLDADWIAFAGSVGVEICRLSSSWALILETVKASGVILLLGVGSLVCYKLYHHYWPSSRSRVNSPSSSPPHSRYGEGFIFYHIRDENQLVEDLDEEDISNIEGRYFGPTPPPSKSSLQHGIDVAKFLRKSKFFSILPSSSASESGASCEDDTHYADGASDGYLGDKSSRCSCTTSPCGLQHLSRTPWVFKPHSGPGLHRACLQDGNVTNDSDSNWLMQRFRNMLPISQYRKKSLDSSSSSLPVTPGSKVKHKTKERKVITNWEDGWKFASPSSCKDKNSGSDIISGVMLSRKSSFGSNCSPIFAQSRLIRDESFDSLGFSRRLPREGSFDSTCSELSLDVSLPEALSLSANETSTMLCLDNLQHEIDQLKNHCLMMDEEFETIKCNRNLPGMSSLMNANARNSRCSENMEQNAQDALQEKIAQENARKCFAGLYSLTTIKNSTSSELSDSFTANGRASVGSAESLAWDSPVGVASPVKSCDANEPVTAEKINYVVYDNSDSKTKPVMSKVVEEPEPEILKSETASVQNEDNSLNELEWDEEGLTDFVDEEEEEEEEEEEDDEEDDEEEEEEKEFHHTEQFNTEKQLSSEPEIGKSSNSKILNDMMGSIMSTSSFSERSSKAESSGFESKLSDSVVTDASFHWHSDWDQNINPWGNQTLDESGFLEWDNNINCSRQEQRPWNFGSGIVRSGSELSTPQSECLTSEAASPVSNFPCTPTNTIENIGPKINIFEYAVKEWQGQTTKAERILRGYSEIPRVLGIQYLRRVRGDNYCGVRAALFQILSRDLPVPSGSKVYCYLSDAFRTGNDSWLKNWNFAGRLPYEASNVLHGMKSCLESLDNVVSVISTSEDKQKIVAMLLNQNPSLDLHLMEAVKLHMLMSGMKLYEASTAGHDVPLFAMLMFARDTSETPRDLMNNHLKDVGNTGGLEQVEMFLLGYALEVTLKIVRPAAYGTEDYICCFPDWNLGKWPEVVLVAEDDRHYNVLVN